MTEVFIIFVPEFQLLNIASSFQQAETIRFITRRSVEHGTRALTVLGYVK